MKLAENFSIVSGVVNSDIGILAFPSHGRVPLVVESRISWLCSQFEVSEASFSGGTMLVMLLSGF